MVVPSRVALLLLARGVPLQASTEIRVIDGAGGTTNAGLLQVSTAGTFGTVCGLNDGAASLACRMLGYDFGVVTGQGLMGMGGPPSPVAMQNLHCSEGAFDFAECSWSLPEGECLSHSRDSLVFCTLDSAQSIYAPGSVRLLAMDGAPSSNGSGRLEVFSGGVWGSVCSLGFADVSANLACRVMGFAGGAVEDVGASCTDQCPPAIVSEVGCAGDEEELLNCPHVSGDDVFCAPEEAVTVTCKGTGDPAGRPSGIASGSRLH